MKATKNHTRTTTKEYYAVVTNTGYGLYAGWVDPSPADLAAGIVHVRGCRHIAHWQGRRGGITSLAAHGPCGPRVSESRIGAPVDSVIRNVANVFRCESEAIAAFEAIKW